MKGDLQAVQQCLQEGAQVHHADRAGKTALHHAAGAGAYAVCEELLRLLADVNSREAHGGTPLDDAEYWSVKSDSAEMRERCWVTIELLHAHGGKRSGMEDRDDGDFILQRRQKLEFLALGKRLPVPWLSERFLQPLPLADASHSPVQTPSGTVAPPQAVQGEAQTNGVPAPWPTSVQQDEASPATPPTPPPPPGAASWSANTVAGPAVSGSWGAYA